MVLELSKCLGVCLVFNLGFRLERKILIQCQQTSTKPPEGHGKMNVRI